MEATQSVRYSHSKTGNIYYYLGEAKPVVERPSDYTILMKAKCSENKGVEVTIYEHEEGFVYVVKDNPKLHENTLLKALYERDGELYVRSLYDFHTPVTVKDKVVPRFEIV